MNIYDIAQLAGVSIATVSRVVNDSDKVSEKTKEKVRRVMEEAGYTPNAFAQGLGLNTMHTVGILVPNISDIYMSAAVSYLQEILHENGYQCLLSCSGFALEQKQAHVSMLLNKRIDALVLIGSTYAGSGEDDQYTDFIREASASVPVFLVNGIVEGDNIYCAVCDDEAASFSVTEKLLKDGRRRILFLTNSSSFSARQKEAGYLRALKQAGVHADPDLIQKLPSGRIHAVRDSLLHADDLSFDACLATDDEIAVGVVKYAGERGIPIPEKLAVVGYNNSAFAVASTPELTSVDARLEELCRNTASSLLALLRGKTVRRVTLSHAKLVERGTTTTLPV